MGDYATFALMPVSGNLALTEADRASDFRHEDKEIAQPSYYRVHLDTWGSHCGSDADGPRRALPFHF